MALYALLDTSSGKVETVDGWDEVGKILRDRPEVPWLVYRISKDLSQASQVDITAIRTALEAGAYEIGTMEPA